MVFENRNIGLTYDSTTKMMTFNISHKFGCKFTSAKCKQSLTDLLTAVENIFPGTKGLRTIRNGDSVTKCVHNRYAVVSV